jgi:glycosyltransferase involved in cell wall biosynthesis
MRISFFFPVYNDEMTVRPIVEMARGVLASGAEDFEIIVVDDASPDRSGAIADALQAEDPRVRAVHHPRNLGFGQALRTGFNAARFEWIAFTDGDMQYDVGELVRFLPHIAEADILVGYRENRADGSMRALFSRLFNFCLRRLIGLNLRDGDCGFKLIRKDVVDAVRVDYPYKESFYLIEMMRRAAGRGYRIREVPVTHHPRAHGVSQVMSLASVWRYAFYTLRGFICRLSGAWS